jgi:16S rRNA processing protein RimM
VFLGESLRSVDLLSVRIADNAAILAIDGVTTRDAAAGLRGELLYVPRAEAARPPSGEFLWHEVIGLSVVTDDGRELGRVDEILRTGANDVYVVRGTLGEVLIPAIADVILRIDPASGTIVIHPMPGLLPGEP